MNNAEVLITFKGDASGVESATKQVQSSFKNMQRVGEIALTALTTAIDKMAINILGAGIEYNAQIETYLTRLTTLTGSAEKANDILEQIKKDALATPFEVSSLTQAESLLLATGMSAEEARADILALGDAVSASGGGNVELQRMAINLQQIKNVGKASSLDIKQFAYAGIDIFGLLADSTGKTRAELSEMPITYDMLREALQKATSEGGRYYNAMEAQSKTYNGAMSNLKESLDVLKGALAQDLFNALKGLIPILTDFANWLTKNHKIIEALAIPILVFFNTFMLLMGLKKLIGIIQAINAVMLANPVFAIIAGIVALIAVLAYLYTHCEGFRKIVNKVFNAVKKVIQTVINFVIGYFKLLFSIYKTIFTTMLNIIKGVINFIINIPTTVMNIVKAVIGFIQNLPYTIGYILGFIIGKIAKFFVDAWKFCVDFITVKIPSFIKSLIKQITSLPGRIALVIKNFATELRKKWHDIKRTAIEIFKNMVKAIVDFFISLPGKVKEAIKKIPEKVEEIRKEIIKKIEDFKNAGKDLIEGLWKGIQEKWDNLKKNVKDFGNGIKNGFKKAFGIHSPSKMFRDEIGAYLSEGIVVGFTANMDKNSKQMIDSLNNAFELSPTLTGTANTHFSPNFNVVVNNNMKTDPLGQVVNRVKTFSGGAKNDYNYGYGG